MINNDGSISLINEDGSQIKVCILLNFEIEEFKKKYIAYTILGEEQNDKLDVLISEIDYDTYKIKNIPEEDMSYILEVYNKIKESLLAQ